MTGHQRQAAEIQIPTAIATSVAIAVAAWTFGSIGVAWASAAGMSVQNLLTWWYVRRKTGLDPSLIGVFWWPKGGIKPPPEKS